MKEIIYNETGKDERERNEIPAKRGTNNNNRQQQKIVDKNKS